MIMQHCMIMYGVNGGEGSALGDLVLLMGTAPAAPVFMLIMGIFFLRANDLKATALRGIKLIIMGYLLNLLRFVLPVLLAGNYPPSGPDSPLGLLLAIDILQMAGLSLIIMSAIRRLPPISWLLLALLVLLISPLLWPLQHPDILWGSGQNVYFPLFPWAFYPLLGMYWGSLFNQTGNRARFMKRSAQVGAGLMLAGGLIWAFVDTPWLPVGDYYRSGLGVHLVITGFVLIWLWEFRLIEQRVAGSKPAELLIFWSKNVTSIYMIQWILIGWGVLLLDYQKLSPTIAVAVGLLMTAITHALTKSWIKLRHSV